MACAGGESGRVVCPISAFSKIRAAATDHARGNNAPYGGQARIAVANCRIYGKAMRNILVSGSIFAPFEQYMTPEAYCVGETFAVAMGSCARDTTLWRPFPDVLEDYAGIAIRGGVRRIPASRHRAPCRR